MQNPLYLLMKFRDQASPEVRETVLESLAKVNGVSGVTEGVNPKDFALGTISMGAHRYGTYSVHLDKGANPETVMNVINTTDGKAGKAIDYIRTPPVGLMPGAYR